jgi:hypothetical protein
MRAGGKRKVAFIKPDEDGGAAAQAGFGLDEVETSGPIGWSGHSIAGAARNCARAIGPETDRGWATTASTALNMKTNTRIARVIARRMGDLLKIDYATRHRQCERPATAQRSTSTFNVQSMVAAATRENSWLRSLYQNAE